MGDAFRRRSRAGARIPDGAVELVRRTFAVVEANAPQATALFCRRLEQVSPDVRAVLPNDLAQRAGEVVARVAVIVQALGDSAEVARLAEDLARSPAVDALRQHHYDAIGDAMVWTVSTGLGHLFTSAHREAWLVTYAAVAAILVQATRRSASAAAR